MIHDTIRPAIERMHQSVLTRERSLLVPGLDWPHKLRRPPRPSVWEETAHEFDELAYVDEGACAMVVERQAHRIPAGAVCIIPSGKRHYEAPVAPQTPYTIYWMRLSSTKLQINANTYSPEDHRLHLQGSVSLWACNEMRTAFDFIVSEIRQRQPYIDRILRGYLIALAGLMFRQCEEISGTALSEHPDEIVRKAANYVQANFHRSGLTVGEIAKHVALNSCYFSEYFKCHTGCTPYRYLLLQRMERARHLLLTTSWTVARIADEVGFSSPYHFSTSFKQFNMMPPTDFRRHRSAKQAV